ncbi:exodeoxyribonuclease VII large subunit [bacterium]|nr:MAG: exodeoxyribonuclease VII large subunit [bacterium]
MDAEIERKSLTVAEYVNVLNVGLSKLGARVCGEVTSVSPSGKAMYFKIRDKKANAFLECMIWLNAYHTNGLKLQVGDEIIVTGVPDYYAPFGKMSFKANTIEYAGQGQLKRDYDRLKTQLETEGLFAESRKRPIPQFPKKIGIITSMHGVVIQDFTTNIGRHGFRFTAIDSRVEGKDALHDILNSLHTMSTLDIDLLVIIRGGGSLESMQPFNTESIVRAVSKFKVPVLTGIGHDTDVTLTQLVADAPCSTPTAVAEKINQPWDGLRDRVARLESLILNNYRNTISDKYRNIHAQSQNLLRTYERRLNSVRTDLQNHSSSILSSFHTIGERIKRANASVMKSVGIMRNNLKSVSLTITQSSRSIRKSMRGILNDTKNDMQKDMTRIARIERTSISTAVTTLDSLKRSIKAQDPERNLKLGYSLSYINGGLARSIADVKPGDILSTKLANGSFESEVKEIKL